MNEWQATRIIYIYIYIYVGVCDVGVSYEWIHVGVCYEWIQVQTHEWVTGYSNYNPWDSCSILRSNSFANPEMIGLFCKRYRSLLQKSPKFSWWMTQYEQILMTHDTWLIIDEWKNPRVTTREICLVYCAQTHSLTNPHDSWLMIHYRWVKESQLTNSLWIRHDSVWTSHGSLRMHMGWLRLVGSLELQVSFPEYCLFYRALLQKRPIFLRSLLIVATP